MNNNFPAIRRPFLDADYPYSNYSYAASPSILKTPESEIAEQHPLATIKLLDKFSQRQLYEAGSGHARDIISTYLNCSSAKGVDDIEGIDINMKHHTRFFLGKDNGFSMSIEFRKVK